MPQLTLSAEQLAMQAETCAAFAAEVEAFAERLSGLPDAAMRLADADPFGNAEIRDRLDFLAFTLERPVLVWPHEPMPRPAESDGRNFDPQAAGNAEWLAAYRANLAALRDYVVEAGG